MGRVHLGRPLYVAQGERAREVAAEGEFETRFGREAAEIVRRADARTAGLVRPPLARYPCPGGRAGPRDARAGRSSPVQSEQEAGQSLVHRRARRVALDEVLGREDPPRNRLARRQAHVPGPVRSPGARGPPSALVQRDAVHHHGGLAPVVADRAVLQDARRPAAVEVHFDGQPGRAAGGLNRDPGRRAEPPAGADGHPAPAGEKHPRRAHAQMHTHDALGVETDRCDRAVPDIETEVARFRMSAVDTVGVVSCRVDGDIARG